MFIYYAKCNRQIQLIYVNYIHGFYSYIFNNALWKQQFKDITIFICRQYLFNLLIVI